MYDIYILYNVYNLSVDPAVPFNRNCTINNAVPFH